MPGRVGDGDELLGEMWSENGTSRTTDREVTYFDLSYLRKCKFLQYVYIHFLFYVNVLFLFTQTLQIKVP